MAQSLAKMRKLLATETRYAVIDKAHNEVLTANHRVIGEAFNTMNEDFVGGDLIVVATKNDNILGQVDRRGRLTGFKPKLETIWSDLKLKKGTT